MVRILLGENDADHLDLIAYAFRRQGFHVSIALDGQTVISKWRSEEPDLIILETALPKVSGLEVCRLVRAESYIPIIFISEASSDQEIVSAFEAGADDYVVKPFSVRQLVARARAASRRATYINNIKWWRWAQKG